MREIWRGALRGGGLLLKHREPQTDHMETQLLLSDGPERTEAAAHASHHASHDALRARSDSRGV